MKIIAHRANLFGPMEESENDPLMVDKCIEMGFDVEIDLWFDKNKQQFLLGHDKGEYSIDLGWILERRKSLWIHCKGTESILKISEMATDLNYFWHNKDDYTFTSKGIIWAYPGNVVNEIGVLVMPEWANERLESQNVDSCYGICTDYPIKIKESWLNNEKT